MHPVGPSGGFLNDNDTEAQSHALQKYQGRSPDIPLDLGKQVLDLSRRFLGCAGLAALLPTILTAKHLKKLLLSHTHLGNLGVAELVQALRQHPSIEEVDLCHNPITTTGGKDLLELIKDNLNITSIGLAGTSIHRLILDCIQMQLARNSRRATYQQHSPLLRSVFRLQSLTEAQLTDLAQALQHFDFPAGTVLLRASTPVSLLYLIREGTVYSEMMPGLQCVAGRPLEEEQFFTGSTALQTWVAQTHVRCEGLPWVAYAKAMGFVSSLDATNLSSSASHDSPLSTSELSYFDLSSESADFLSPSQSEGSGLFSPVPAHHFPVDGAYHPTSQGYHTQQNLGYPTVPHLWHHKGLPPHVVVASSAASHISASPPGSLPVTPVRVPALRRLEDSSPIFPANGDSSVSEYPTTPTTGSKEEFTPTMSDDGSTTLGASSSGSSQILNPNDAIEMASLLGQEPRRLLDSTERKGSTTGPRQAVQASEDHLPLHKNSSLSRSRLHKVRERAHEMLENHLAEPSSVPHPVKLLEGADESHNEMDEPNGLGRKASHRRTTLEKADRSNLNKTHSTKHRHRWVLQDTGNFSETKVNSQCTDAHTPNEHRCHGSRAVEPVIQVDQKRNLCISHKYGTAQLVTENVDVVTEGPQDLPEERRHARRHTAHLDGRPEVSRKLKYLSAPTERCGDVSGEQQHRHHNSISGEASMEESVYDDLLVQYGITSGSPPRVKPAASHKYGSCDGMTKLTPALAKEIPVQDECMKRSLKPMQCISAGPLRPGTPAGHQKSRKTSEKVGGSTRSTESRARAGSQSLAQILVNPQPACELSHLGVVYRSEDGSAGISQPLISDGRFWSGCPLLSPPSSQVGHSDITSPGASFEGHAHSAKPVSLPPSLTNCLRTSRTSFTLPPAWTPRERQETAERWAWASHLQIVAKPEEDRRWLQGMFADECIFGLTMNEARRIAAFIDHMRLERFEGGEYLMHRGNAVSLNDKMFIVMSGTYRVEPQVEDPADRTPVVGEMELLRDLPPQSNIVVASSTLVAYTLQRSAYRRLRALEGCQECGQFLRDGVPALQDLTRKEILSLRRHLRRATLLEGEILVSHGEPLDHLFIVVAGVVKLSGPGGVDAMLQAGEVFGDLELVHSHPTALFTAKGVEDALLFALSRSDFWCCARGAVSAVQGSVQEVAADFKYYVCRDHHSSCLLPEPSEAQCLENFRFGDPEPSYDHCRPGTPPLELCTPSSTQSFDSVAAVGDPKLFSKELVVFLSSGRRRRPGLSGPCAAQLFGLRGDGSPKSLNTFVPMTYAKSEEETELLRGALPRCCLMSNLGSQVVDILVAAMQPVKATAGEVIVQCGTSGRGSDTWYVVADGICTEYAPQGFRGTRTAGDSFGLHALMFTLQADYGATAQTSCHLFALERLTYQRIVVAHFAVRRMQFCQTLQSLNYMCLLTEEEVSGLADALLTHHAPKGAILMRSGDKRSALYIILDGIVSQSGRGGAGELGPGNIVGAWEFFSPEASTMTYTAKTEVQVAMLSVLTFEAMVEPMSQYRARLLDAEFVNEKVSPDEKELLVEAVVAAVLYDVPGDQRRMAATVVDAMVLQRFRQGQCLWHSGWPHPRGEQLCIVRTGQCVLYCRDHVVEVMGEMSFVGDWSNRGCHGRYQKVVVQSPVLEVFTLSQSCYQSFICSTTS